MQRKREIDKKIIRLYSCFIDCHFKNFETTDKEERFYLLEILYISQCYRVAWIEEKVEDALFY